jgi:outer membrane cobalamin receptor
MLGKAVKIRHCPATVSGSFSPVLATALNVKCGKAITSWEPQVRRPVQHKRQRLFSEGEKKMTTLTFLFFLFASSTQTANGTVLDAGGAAVAGAHVEISAAGATRVVKTNETGQFSTEIPTGAYSLRISATGFATYTGTIQVPSDVRQFILQVAPHTDDVIVTATRVETPLANIGVSASVLDRNAITEQQAPTIFELMRDVPGLAVSNTSRRGGTTSIYTRGGGAEANLVLVDGVQMNDPGGGFNFAHLMPTNVDRIEVVRGPQSASYGSNAGASAIQIVTHRGSPEDGLASGFVEFEGGTFGTYKYGSGVSGAVKAFDYSIAADHLGTQGEYTNDGYRNLTLSENTGFRLNDRSQVRLTARSIGSWVGTPNKVDYGLIDPDAFRTDHNIVGGVRYEQRGTFSNRIQLGFTRLSDYFQDNSGEGPFKIGAVVSGTPGARGSAGVRLVRFLSSTDLALSDYTVPPGDSLVLKSVVLNPTAPSNTITQRRSAEYQGGWNYSPQGSLIFGYDFEQERGVTNIAPPLRNDHGLFINHQHSLGKKLFLTESVRLEDNSVFHKKVTPRFAASYSLTATTRLKTSAGTGITEPSFLEVYSNDPTFVGNRNLKPERSQSAEAGIEQHLLRSALVVDATAFDTTFHDLIVFVFSTPPALPTWINLEASRAQGVESSATFRASWLRLHGQYTFLDTRVTAAATPTSSSTGIGQELPHRPRHSGSIDATATFRRGFVNLSTTFVGERQDSDGVGFGVVRNPRYERVDLGGSYTLNHSVDLFLRVGNLLNEHYEEILGYPALSRNALAGMKVRWGRH